MTTQMADALKTAFDTNPGTALRLPTKPERIWRWVKDHPHSTAEEIAAGVRIPLKDVVTVVYLMSVRRSQLARRNGHRFGRSVLEYSAAGKEYEAPTRGGRRSKHAKPVQEVTPAVCTEHTPAQPIVPAFDIEAYPLRDLRAIYAQLHKLFGKEGV